MSHAHEDAIAELELPTVHKAVLWQFGYRACRFCGLAWPGVPWLSRKAGLSESTTRLSLAWLLEHRYLVIHWQARGGRGYSSEYLVIPEVVLLHGAPCPECIVKLKPHRNGPGPK